MLTLVSSRSLVSWTYSVYKAWSFAIASVLNIASACSSQTPLPWESKGRERCIHKVMRGPKGRERLICKLGWDTYGKIRLNIVKRYLCKTRWGCIHAACLHNIWYRSMSYVSVCLRMCSSSWICSHCFRWCTLIGLTALRNGWWLNSYSLVSIPRVLQLFLQIGLEVLVFYVCSYRSVSNS